MKPQGNSASPANRADIFFDEAAWLNEWDRMVTTAKKLRRCARCIYGADIPGITFDHQGVCSFCAELDRVEKECQTGKSAGIAHLESVVSNIKKQGRGKPYDVVVGVSGGTDSSYLLHLTREMGLRPIAVHFDNTWNSQIAVENIYRMLSKLNVELDTYVVDAAEYDDLYRSFLRAGVMDLDCPTDIGIATVLNRAADKYQVNYVLEGHSFQTEGIFPIGWFYMDAKYIDSIQKEFGSVALKSFPNLWLSSQLRWMLVRRLRRVRPLWYLHYDKAKARNLLEKEYGWKWYGGHHLENRITAFFHTYFVPRRFGIDTRVVGDAALVRTSQLDRSGALEALWTPPEVDYKIVDLVLKRFGLTQGEFVDLMLLPKRTYKEFPTYKKTFERYRLFFWLMAKYEFIPKSFYLKYSSRQL